MVARSEYLVCIDGDAVLDPNATAHLVNLLIRNPRVGAVTGNPRIRTRSTMLGKVQVGAMLLYEDSAGNIAVAVAIGDAAASLGLRQGDRVRIRRA